MRRKNGFCHFRKCGYLSKFNSKINRIRCAKTNFIMFTHNNILTIYTEVCFYDFIYLFARLFGYCHFISPIENLSTFYCILELRLNRRESINSLQYFQIQIRPNVSLFGFIPYPRDSKLSLHIVIKRIYLQYPNCSLSDKHIRSFSSASWG